MHVASPLHPSHQAASSCQVHPAVGQLHVIFGPMFSGKTLVVFDWRAKELIRRCKRYQVAKYKCTVVKYAKDVRYTTDDQVSTHDRQTLNAIPALSLTDVYDELLKYEVIGIDEGQFFCDIVDVAERLANAGKTVIVAALDGDFRRQGFGGILGLVPKAETVIKLRAVCMRCFKDAAFTKRMTSDTSVELIGGTDKYTAVCRACHPAPVDRPRLVDEAVQTPGKENADPDNCDGGVKRVSSQKNLFGDAGGEPADKRPCIQQH